MLKQEKADWKVNLNLMHLVSHAYVSGSSRTF